MSIYFGNCHIDAPRLEFNSKPSYYDVTMLTIDWFDWFQCMNPNKIKLLPTQCPTNVDFRSCWDTFNNKILCKPTTSVFKFDPNPPSYSWIRLKFQLWHKSLLHREAGDSRLNDMCSHFLRKSVGKLNRINKSTSPLLLLFSDLLSIWYHRLKHTVSPRWIHSDNT